MPRSRSRSRSERSGDPPTDLRTFRWSDTRPAPRATRTFVPTCFRPARRTDLLYDASVASAAHSTKHNGCLCRFLAPGRAPHGEELPVRGRAGLNGESTRNKWKTERRENTSASKLIGFESRDARCQSTGSVALSARRIGISRACGYRRPCGAERCVLARRQRRHPVVAGSPYLRERTFGV
jgi:hypothetical protein